MKKFLYLIFLFSTVQLFAQKSIPKPNPARLVVDNAGVLDPYDRDVLERRLVALDDSSSNQIVILTVNTLNDEPIEDVAINTFRNWGIGNKKTNNGILILVAIQDRKVRIEVGYGLEGAIPDIVANSIIDNDLKPNFKLKNYYAGFNAAVDDLAKAAVGEYKVSNNRNNGKTSGKSLFTFILILIAVIFFIAIGSGGRRGGGGGGLMAPLLLGSMLNDIGRRSGGSSWGDGGGSFGGGFGGFGGGSSGGGGASGSW